MTALPQSVVLSDQVLYQELEGEAVLLDLDKEHYYGLDGVGMRLWQLLDEHGDPEAAVKAIVAEYEVDEATVRRDVAVWIEKLSEAGLLTIAPI